MIVAIDAPHSFYAFTTERMHYSSYRLHRWSECNRSHGMKHLVSINEIFSKELLQCKHLLVLHSHLISDHQLIIKNVSISWTCSRPLQVSTYRSSSSEPLILPWHSMYKPLHVRSTILRCANCLPCQFLLIDYEDFEVKVFTFIFSLPNCWIRELKTKVTNLLENTFK